MIRRGKQAGWLHLPKSALSPWLLVNTVEIDGVEVQDDNSPGTKGAGIYATTSELAAGKAMITVPRYYVLSLEMVMEQAKLSRHLSELLIAVGDFGKSARGAILLFLLVQASYKCPDLPIKIGVGGLWTEYIRFLPLEDLPTFWDEDDLELLQGTSLLTAVEAKMKSLQREFEHVRTATSSIEWCQKYWWDEIDGVIDFEDWKILDSFYRSRAMELPGVGACMVPCIDMANHASGDATDAIYESDTSGSALLLLRDGRKVSVGDEITISYGEEKGACEMIFSYGFLENGFENARHIFLDLAIPDDDPLKHAKLRVSTAVPGVKLSDGPDGITWDSDFVSLICVNEEDGLEIAVAQTVSGERELTTSWKGQIQENTEKLAKLILQSPLKEIYQLRALAVIQARVEEQCTMLEERMQNSRPAGEGYNKRRSLLSEQLVHLEYSLLEKASIYFQQQMSELASSPFVQRYLELMNARDTELEDFS